MSIAFSARPAPSAALPIPILRAATTVTVVPVSSPPSSPTKEHHHRPPASHISHPTQPILYLPPLLPPVPSLPDTPPLDPASLSLHKALHHFRPFPNYASLPYASAFNWSALALDDVELEREWYAVVFRSKRRGRTGGERDLQLYEADRLAHEEAIRNGGLLMYWYGKPDRTGANLATCIWTSRKAARAANARPDHIKAVRLAAESYEYYDLERHVLTKRRGETGISLAPYIEGEVGW